MYKLKNGFIIREIGNQFMAVPIGKQTSEIHGMIALSESGKLLWHTLEKGATVDDLAKTLTENYEVEYDVALKDAQNFVQALTEQGALDL